MSVPSKRIIESEISKLRTIIEAEKDDDILARIAYAVETALRWSIEDTKGWKKPSEDVYTDADLLRQELRRKK
jgi:hypothetical protein